MLESRARWGELAQKEEDHGQWEETLPTLSQPGGAHAPR